MYICALLYFKLLIRKRWKRKNSEKNGNHMGKRGKKQKKDLFDLFFYQLSANYLMPENIFRL